MRIAWGRADVGARQDLGLAARIAAGEQGLVDEIVEVGLGVIAGGE
jgi:hypothetical protein